MAFFWAEENVRPAAAPIIILLHLGVGNQIRDFLVQVKLLGRHRADRALEKGALEGAFAIQNLIDQAKIIIELAGRFRQQPTDRRSCLRG